MAHSSGRHRAVAVPTRSRRRGVVAGVAALVVGAAALSSWAATSPAGAPEAESTRAVSAAADVTPLEQPRADREFRTAEPTTTAPAEPVIELPGGGRSFFPAHRLVALYGKPGVRGLGVLGEQDLPGTIARVQATAAEYQAVSDRPIMPTLDIIATVADTSPGPDGDYSRPTSVDELRPWIEAAAAAGVYVVLDLQPGRSTFMDQARVYEELLRYPNVGLGLDPEWRVGPGQVPGDTRGTVGAAEVNEVQEWLAGIVTQGRLPQKLLIVHQFVDSMIADKALIHADRPEVAVLVQMDAQGPTITKGLAWKDVLQDAPAGMAFGWMNFLTLDEPMLNPADTLAQQPTPDLISIQ